VTLDSLQSTPSEIEKSKYRLPKKDFHFVTVSILKALAEKFISIEMRADVKFGPVFSELKF
jgi:hypothetical protein